MKIYFLKYLIVLFLLPASVTAQEQRLSLEVAIALALKNDLGIQILKNNESASNILNDYGVAGGLPLVTGTINNNEQVTTVNQKLNSGININRNNAAANNFNAGVTGSILVYNGGRVVAAKERLKQLEAQGTDYINEQIQNIVAQVMVNYYDVVRQQEYMKTIDTSIVFTRRQVRIIDIRKSVGLANNADEYQAKIDMNELQQNRLAQELVVAQSKASLLRLLTLPTDSAFLIQDTIVVDGSIDLREVQNTVTKNPALLAAEKNILINEQIVKETNALRYPSLRANAGYNFTRNKAAAGNLLLNQNYGPTIGFSIGVPIFNGNVFRKQKQVAELDVQNAILQKQLQEEDFKVNITNQYLTYTNTKSQLDSAKQNYVLSKKLLDLSTLRFEYKQATFLEVKNARESFELAGYRLVNLSYAAKAAEIGLKLVGSMLEY